MTKLTRDLIEPRTMRVSAEAGQEEARLDDLANDTIRIALNIVGLNPNSMDQFERASAMLNMAQECQYLRGRNMLLNCHRRHLMEKCRVHGRE